MQTNTEEKIIQVLSYFDVFEYPLTFGEIKKYLEVKVDISDEELFDIINGIPIIQEANGFYYFLGRYDNVLKRIERQKISSSKIAKAKVITKVLCFIPTIRYIGLSGSLSMESGRVEDDIDMFFITRANSLWITRLLVYTVLKLFGQQRQRNVKIAIDKVCPNMFVDEQNLKLKVSDQNLYRAHEIAQLKTLFDRENFHTKLLSDNRWILKFLPNIFFEKRRNRFHKDSVADLLLKPLERIFYKLQKKYMDRHKTYEKISGKIAMFHPVDKSALITELYQLKVRRYKELYFDDQWLDRIDAGYYFNEKKARILN